MIKQYTYMFHENRSGNIYFCIFRPEIPHIPQREELFEVFPK